MNIENYNLVGVMSGTSLDGVDLAHITFNHFNEKWSFEILECETVAYTDHWIQQLKEAVGFSEKELSVLNKNYTDLLASIIKSFIKRHQIQNLDAVCSHGHTILHQPQNGFT